MIKFTKMHGTGNDYIYINSLKTQIKNPGELAKKMCKRHTGIGADGLILILKSETDDFKMRIFNPDGSEAEMCGNGIRCFGKYVYDNNLSTNKKLSIETLAGTIKLNLQVKNKLVHTVDVDMGEPILQRERIPMIGDPGMVIDETLPLNDGTKFQITSISMGNPHVIIFVEDVENFPVEKYGSIIENHDLFPKRTNVEFIQIINKNEVIQRTWERGSGETLSCGTGASAATAALILNKKCNRKIKINLKGGILKTMWDEKDNHIHITGPVVKIFDGTWEE